MSFWLSDRWHAYEAVHDGPPGTRAALLASAGWSTQLVDLSRPEVELWSSVRRSYHALIHRCERSHSLRVFGFPSPSYPGASTIGMEAYRYMHESVSKQFRDPETWRLMRQWLDDGAGLLVGASDHGTLAWSAFAYFFIDDDRWAYYASAVSRDRSVNHAIVWHAMLTLKARGVRWLELGWQGEAQDKKGKAVEFFKRGFGGEAIPVREVE